MGAACTGRFSRAWLLAALPHLQVRKLGLREVMPPSQGHAVSSRWWGRESSLGCQLQGPQGPPEAGQRPGWGQGGEFRESTRQSE